MIIDEIRNVLIHLYTIQKVLLDVSSICQGPMERLFEVKKEPKSFYSDL